jgi:TolB-like protein
VKIIRPPAALVLALSLALLAPGCAKNRSASQVWQDTMEAIPVVGKDPSLEIHSVRSIKTVKVHRLAVMPLIEHPNATGEPIEEGAPESLTADIYSRISLVSGWEVAPESDVRDVMSTLPPTTLADMQQNALKLGHQLSADAVVYGTVTRYKERVGSDYAAKSPAAVAFAIHVIDVNNGVVLWTARYAREQKALTQNIFNLANFVENRGRWVRAHDIAQRGVEEAVADLSSKLSYSLPVTPVPMPPGTGTY